MRHLLLKSFLVLTLTICLPSESNSLNPASELPPFAKMPVSSLWVGEGYLVLEYQGVMYRYRVEPYPVQFLTAHSPVWSDFIEKTYNPTPN